VKTIGKRVIACVLVAVISFGGIIGIIFALMSKRGNDGGTEEIYSVGPGGGGAIAYPTINPQDDNNITISCDMASTFTSTNGGASFKSHQFPDITKYDYSPHDKNIVYAYNRQQVYISRDRGDTFDYFAPNADMIEKIGHNMRLPNAQNEAPKIIYNDHFLKSPVTGNFDRSNLDGYRISKVYVHPADPNTIFILADGYSATYSPLAVYVSRDGGKNFSRLAQNFAGDLVRLRSEAFQNAILVKDNGTHQTVEYGEHYTDYIDMIVIGERLYIMGNNGIYVLDCNTGAVVTQNPIKNRDGQFVYKNGDLTTYIIPANDDLTKNGLEIKKCIGTGFDAWTTVLGGTDYQTNFWGKLKMHDNEPVRVVSRAPIFSNLKIAASDPNTMYVHFASAFGDNKNNTLDKSYATNNSAGIAVTRDGGATWFWAFEGIVKDYMSIGSRAEMGGGANRNCFELVVGNDPNHAIICEYYTAWETRDGGQTWRSMESRTVQHADGSKSYTTTGIEPAVQHAFAADPGNPKHQFAGWTDIGLWETFDGGKSWSKVKFTDADGNILLNSVDCWGIAFDPNNPNVILASNVNSNHYSVAYLSNEILDKIHNNTPTSIKGHIVRSTDGGKTWAVAEINERALPTDIIFDPTHNNVAYFSSNGIGVFKSADGGVTWSLFNNGISAQTAPDGRSGIGAHKLTLAADKKTLFLHTGRTPVADYERMGDTYFLDLLNPVTWQKLNRPNNPNGTWIYSIDRAPNGTMYAGTAVRRKLKPNGNPAISNNDNYFYEMDGECGGVYVSADNGATWTQMFDETASVNIIKIDTRDPSKMYIAAMGKIYTFKDDWREVAKLPHIMPRQIHEDPTDKNRILVLTRGGGTWSVPIKY
jgi:photosystem II stability/assembly factor-like uncharacterized protein